MDTEVMFSSKTDLWETPQKFFDELDAEFHFNLDVCVLCRKTLSAKSITRQK